MIAAENDVEIWVAVKSSMSTVDCRVSAVCRVVAAWKKKVALVSRAVDNCET